MTAIQYVLPTIVDRPGLEGFDLDVCDRCGCRSAPGLTKTEKDRPILERVGVVRSVTPHVKEYEWLCPFCYETQLGEIIKYGNQRPITQNDLIEVAHLIIRHCRP